MERSNHQSIASSALGAVESLVGGPQHLVRAGVSLALVGLGESDAYSQGDSHLRSARPLRRGRFLSGPAGAAQDEGGVGNRPARGLEVRNGLRSGGAREEHHEFFSTVAKRPPAASDAAQSPRHHPKRLVADVVSEHIVESLEMIYVHHRYRIPASDS